MRGIEVVQVIQSLDNDVLLVAGKPTVVRVYIDPSGLGAAANLTGELMWRRGDGGANYLPAMNRVRPDPARTPDLQAQRFDITQSLNFRLPGEATRAGILELKLNRLGVPGGDPAALAQQIALTIEFVRSPPLRVRAVGLRYDSVRNPPQVITPQAIHFEYLRSYLMRSYPVAELTWSQIVVDGNNLVPLATAREFPANQSIIANAQLSAIRAREVTGGMDARTHYYGLVDNESGLSFMRGSALYDERAAVFGMVACGPCGVPNGWTGDFDASFADWYGAHELGHTFQRRHPGFPVGVQPPDGLGDWPDEYEHGRISPPTQKYVGFDIGDPALGIPMKALSGEIHHDVMTYADSQWLSAHTYEAIHKQLLFEDQALEPGAELIATAPTAGVRREV
ncbi:hypothetical protein [Sinorhizobium medicae]|uniref:hypothetical protein n=1 Tax=Sinorhizobium medicae TaxID=110321 RepID=UPI001914576D|nr:hypothetical protein [Sinorhizobium medicae]